MIRSISKPLEPLQAVAPPSRRIRRSFRKHDVLRAMAVVAEGGLDVASVEISPDGTIRLSNAQAANAPANRDEFEQWQDRL